VKIVVDTNILVSFFRDNPVRSIIINSEFFKLELFSPEQAIEELRKNKPVLFKYSKLEKDEEFESIISSLNSFVEIKPRFFFEEFKEKSEKISPDKKDSMFFALSLKLNCPIWSNEPRLKRQSSVNVFSTSDLRKLLNI